ncbi:hypothetical protein BJ878DRAFT_552768 [Calycina marina]|uniref:SET domain-containing protein n=1 Tax=Calycina marina TaxID=1763456 RepID=A0A9P7Z9F0_9HELO|nr:hypothetical protein BJ878DRAFT_552768 [Calycina marina]
MDPVRCVAILDEHKERLKENKKRAGARLRGLKLTNELNEYHQELALSQKLEQTAISTHSNILDVYYMATPYPPSDMPLNQLKKININDFTVETHHRGSHILLRVSSTAYRPRMCGMTNNGLVKNDVTSYQRLIVMAVVTDEAGTATPLALYYQQMEILQPAVEILPLGQVLVVKEPFWMIDERNDHCIAIHHPTDLIMLSDDDERIPEPWKSITAGMTIGDYWKRQGNTSFKAMKYQKTIEHYSRALRCPLAAGEVITIHTNRAAAYLKIGAYESVIDDTEFVKDPDHRSERALIRGAFAYYALGKYENANILLQAIARRFSLPPEAGILSSKINARLEEQRSGIYAFTDLQAAALAAPTGLDFADFQDLSTETAGRGLFTTAPVNVGQLLLVEKAFMNCYPHIKPADDNQTSTKKFQPAVLVDPHNDHATLGSHVDMIGTISRKLVQNPSLLPAFTDLYSGTYKPNNPITVVDGRPIIDTFLISNIITFNGFTTELSSKGKIIENDSGRSSDELGVGLWIMTSYINHSCCGTCGYATIGDMMIVRANANLPAGKPTSWISYFLDSDEPDLRSTKKWGFTCQCLICQDYKNTRPPTQKKRAGLKEALITSLKRESKMTTEENVSFVTDLEILQETYNCPAKDVPRLNVFHIQVPYLELLFRPPYPNPKTAAIGAIKVLEAIGYVISPRTGWPSRTRKLKIDKWGLMNIQVMNLWMFIAICYDRGNREDLFASAVEYAKLAYRICIGEDATFEASLRTIGYSLRQGDKCAREELRADI